MENVAQASAPVEPSRKRARALRINWGFLRSVGSVLAAAAIWEIAGRTFLSNPLFFAPLSAVLAKGVSLWQSGTCRTDIAVSFEEFSSGSSSASIVGIGVGVLMASSKPVSASARPVGVDALFDAVRGRRAAADAVAWDRTQRAHRGGLHRRRLPDADQHLRRSRQQRS